jgi:hypothetical protein
MNGDQSLATVARTLETIEAQRPSNLAEQLSPIQRSLVALRDELRRDSRNNGPQMDSDRLDRVNQALSLLHAAAYPVGAINWPALEHAGALLRSGS